MSRPGRPRPRLLVPQVVQTSGTDCGPACLTALARGFRLPAVYDRLRDACHTGRDGTAIGTLAELAGELGFEAREVMLPPDHLLEPLAGALPAVVVTRLPDGFTHFVLAWRLHRGLPGGPRLQVMDPSQGRRWLRPGTFLAELHRHRHPVPAGTFRAWAGSEDFLRPLAARLRRLGLAPSTVEDLLTGALDDPAWPAVARLDAAARMTAELVTARALRPGREAEGLLRRALDPDGPAPPASCATVQPIPGDPDCLHLTGAVLVRITPPSSSVRLREARPAGAESARGDGRRATGKPPAPTLARLLTSEGLLTPAVLLLALALAAAGTLTEALLFRFLLMLPEAGTAAPVLGGLVALAGAHRLLAYLAERDLLGLGRRLETRLRLALLRHLPRLPERYLDTRPLSDLAERAHGLYRLRRLPEHARHLAGAGCHLALLTAGLVWLHPAGAGWTLLATGAALSPLLAWPALAEADLAVRTRAGALVRSLLDAFRGATALRAHGGEASHRRRHQVLLAGWGWSRLAQLGLELRLDTAQGLAVTAAVLALTLHHLRHGGGPADLLLLAGWGLQLPVRGAQLAAALNQLARERSTLERLAEPLTAPGEEDDDGEAGEAGDGWEGEEGLDVRLDGVTVRAGERELLRELELHLGPGEHAAVVGRSGAGKSTLAALLLGQHRPASGTLTVGGRALRPGLLPALRRATVWIDPTVTLWNRSLAANLAYGNGGRGGGGGGLDGSAVLDAADLKPLLAGLPEGLATVLGEGGGRLSGGEGQRVRLGRGLARPGARLVLLDEPFRGLPRMQRACWLRAAREHWSRATLLAITHDVEETRSFPRVLVIEDGRIVEDGHPEDLARRPDGAYRALLDAEAQARRAWEELGWHRLRLEAGLLWEEP